MATEQELRNKLVSTAAYYLGVKQGSAQHKAIIDIFNQVKPDGWAMTYSAYWCAAFASACAIKAFGINQAKKYFPLSANCGTIVSKAKKMNIWSYVEPINMTPRWIHIDKRYGKAACGAGYHRPRSQRRKRRDGLPGTS